MVEAITCQGIFRWEGGKEFTRISVKRPYPLMALRRSRKVFFALNIPVDKTVHITEKELANQIIIDLILDEGLEAEYIVHDPQKTVGGFVSPATQQEQTDNPGKAVWIGWMPVPPYPPFMDPGEKDDPYTHNLTVKAAFRGKGSTARLFDAEHGAIVQKYEYRIVDDYKPD